MLKSVKMLYRRIICTNAHRLTFCQKLSFTTEDVQTENLIENTFARSTKRKSKSSFFSKEICEFLRNKSPEYIDFIPKSLMRRTTKNSTKLFIVDECHAKALASMISKELLNDSSYVMDCNPGLGLLTKELLKAGVPFIHLYEINKPFYEAGSPLSALMKCHPKKLKLYEFNFSTVWKFLLKDEHSETLSSQEYFNDIPYGEWRGNTYMQVIEIAPTRRPITLIMYNFFKQTHLFERGRPCFYIGVPAPAWNNLSTIYGRFYSQYTVFFHLFFDLKHLGELPRDAFIPWPREKYWKLDNLDTPVCIVKLEPKKDVFEILAKDDIEPFWHFLKFCLKTNKNKVLAEFEKLVPGSGVKLIQQDCGILTTFKELSPQKLLEIFKMYRSWPEYDEVLFNFSLTVGDDDKKNAEKLEEDEEGDTFEELQEESVDSDNSSTVDKRENS